MACETVLLADRVLDVLRKDTQHTPYEQRGEPAFK